ncbi:MAG: beta-ketoacyl-ACP synthase 3 [Actinomycetota bacterium]
MIARLAITGIGSALPDHRVASAEIEDRIGLAPGWIERRTGIVERPIAEEGEATSDLAVRAGERALADAGIDPGTISLLLLATSTPDHLLPPTAPSIAHRLGCFGAGAIDLAGACSGFLYALVLGESFGRTAPGPVLVIAANVLSRRTDPLDRATASVFADGAGAVVLDAATGDRGLQGFFLGADGSLADAIRVPAGGSRRPITADAIERGEHLMRMERGPALFHAAARAMAEAGTEALKSAGWTTQTVDRWVPHQAGRRLVAESGRLLGIDEARTVDLVARHGNSSAATIPIALAAARNAGTINRGDAVLLTSVGAGLVSAGVALRW